MRQQKKKKKKNSSDQLRERDAISPYLAEQLRQPVFSADDFGDAATTTAGGLVFPSSLDVDAAASVDDLLDAADAASAAAAPAADADADDVDTVGVVSNQSKDPFDVVNKLSDDPFGDLAAAAVEDINLEDYPEGSYVVTDWKGEPMVIYPGDKIPGIM